MEKISLCIMVKNEEDVILKTLESCKTLIDRLFIHDTGSTDNTIQVCKTFCKDNDIKFYLIESEFVDFSTSRNILLEFVETIVPKDEFYMILDANDELKAEWNFVPSLTNVPKETNIMLVNSIWTNSNDVGDKFTHIKALLLRSGNIVRYRGKVHEILTINDQPLTEYFWVDKVHIVQDRSTDKYKTKRRYDRDIELLKQDIRECQKKKESLMKDIEIGRHIYHLVRTYVSKKDFENAKIYCEMFFNAKYKYITPEENSNIRILYANVISELEPDSWGKQLEVLLEAYNYIPNSIEPLLNIISKYCSKKEWNIAYIFSKFSCELTGNGIPLKEMNIVNFHIKRWFLLALICYELKNYEMGKIALQRIGAETMEKYGCPEELDYNIGVLRGMYYPFYHLFGQNIVLIFGGYGYGKWDGTMINGENGLGGAETVITYVSLLLKKKQPLPVLVCCDVEEVKIIENVIFFPIDQYELVVTGQIIDTLFVFRFSSFIRYNENIGKVILVLEDTLPVGYSHGNFELECDDKLQNVVCKTEWHKNYFLEVMKERANEETFNELKERTIVIGNAILPSRFTTEECKKIEKKKWRFMWSSCPTRGAWNMARLIPKIRKIVPEAEFHFFMTFDSPFYQPYHRIPELKDALENLEKTEGVILHPRVSQEVLAKEMLKSDIWLYPTQFCETYCITALEMQMARVLCIYSNPSCLNETVGSRGILMDFDITGSEDDKILSIIYNLKHGKIDKEDYLNRGQGWAEKQSWDNRIEEFLKLI